MTEYTDYTVNNQQQKPNVSGTPSNFGKVISGVRKCSVLGQFLILVYINDLQLVFRKCITGMCAEDSSVSFVFHSFAINDVFCFLM